jgi:Undecaprenyl-phosphate galactose phosphotransferase WbaP
MSHKKRLGILILFLTDVICLLIIIKIALFLRKNVLPFFYHFPESEHLTISFFWWIFPVWLFFLSYEGLYTKKFSFWDEVKMLWKVSFFSTLGVFAILFISKFGEQVSRTTLLLMGIISLSVFPLMRLNIKNYFMKFGLLTSKVLIIGAGKTGELMLHALKKDKNLGLTVAGFVDDDPFKRGRHIDGVKIHRGVDRAHKYIGRCGIEDVIIAMPGCSKEKFITLIDNLQRKTQKIILIPDLFGITVLGTNLQHFFQEQTIGLQLRNNLAIRSNIFIKKIFDVIVSTFLLLILAVPMLVIALLIKISSKEPALYTQKRIGSDGKPFRCYKFRTMHSDADTLLHTLLENDPAVKDEWLNHFKLKDDPRVTRIGSFLRQTSLDELPQILNVLKGEMSLVGPRPVTRREIDEYYRDKADLCFGVSPGITGLWQVSGRSNTDYDNRITLDLWYVRNWNLWLDIVILLKTCGVVLRREGAH